MIHSSIINFATLDGIASISQIITRFKECLFMGISERMHLRSQRLTRFSSSQDESIMTPIFLSTVSLNEIIRILFTYQ